MKKLGVLLAAGLLFAAAPRPLALPAACAGGGVQADLGVVRSRQRRREARGQATIAEAAKTAKARQATKVCVVGQTDKLGDKNYNAKLAQQRSQAVASELIKAGYPAKDVVIASNPEAFGNMSLERQRPRDDRPAQIGTAQGQDRIRSDARQLTIISITTLPTT